MGTEIHTVLATADLHYGNRRDGDACAEGLAEFVSGHSADALAIAGDVADRSPESFRACLRLFSDFEGARLLVPGNHDVWRTGASSAEKYMDLLPRLAGDAGFHMLDTGPLVRGDTAFVGSIGWYDYSLRNPDLGFTTEQYAAKRIRGVATWNDLRFVDWSWTDEEFTERCAEQLRTDYRQAAGRAGRVVAVIHHLPYRELLYGPAAQPYEFCRAYMGSTRFGEVMAGWPALHHVVCGHRHGHAHLHINGHDAWCVGSEYGRKRLLELDLDTGTCTVHLFTPADSGARHRVEAEIRPGS